MKIRCNIITCFLNLERFSSHFPFARVENVEEYENFLIVTDDRIGKNSATLASLGFTLYRTRNSYQEVGKSPEFFDSHWKFEVSPTINEKKREKIKTSTEFFVRRVAKKSRPYRIPNVNYS